MLRNLPMSVAATTLAALFVTTASPRCQDDEPPISEATENCLLCHENLHPGIVGDWRRSRHARTTMAQALQVGELQRRVSATTVPEELLEVVVGCAECHTLSPELHPDTVEHEDERMHPVVTPLDCAVCHPVEMGEYDQNLMAHAYQNLMGNELYGDLRSQINGVDQWQDGGLVHQAPHPVEAEDSCLSCHGTRVEVLGIETRETGLGEMEFPKLSGWPNQGVGRINPDGSRGSCSACHTRHEFSVEIARKPYTCAQCHKGPDVPAYKVYQVSKHGNLFNSVGSHWDFDAVPWIPGEHFSAPTCATCHVSLLAKDEETVLARRTHQMSDRLDNRLFGLPYAHAHPKSPRTDQVRNAAGLPLPTELTGEPVADALIDSAEQAERRATMQRVCSGCHSRNWVKGHFTKLDATIASTNESTKTATMILLAAWEQGVAQGLGEGGSVFDESIERMWLEHWLFFANTTRFASAMMGADYGVFADGRFSLSKNLREMETLLKLQAEKR